MRANTQSVSGAFFHRFVFCLQMITFWSDVQPDVFWISCSRKLVESSGCSVRHLKYCFIYTSRSWNQLIVYWHFWTTIGKWNCCSKMELFKSGIVVQKWNLPIVVQKCQKRPVELLFKSGIVVQKWNCCSKVELLSKSLTCTVMVQIWLLNGLCTEKGKFFIAMPGKATVWNFGGVQHTCNIYDTDTCQCDSVWVKAIKSAQESAGFKNRLLPSYAGISAGFRVQDLEFFC